MTEKRRKQVVFAVLVLAVVWGIYNQPWKRYRSPRDSHAEVESNAMEAGPAPVAAAVVAAAGTSASATLPVTEWTIDPFRNAPAAVSSNAPKAPVEVVPVPVLQGIMTAGGEPVCIIGGKILKQGDRIGQWRVRAITDDQVELEKIADGRRARLSTSGTKAMGDGQKL